MSRAALRRGGAAIVAGLLVAGSLGWVDDPAGARATAACTGSTGITVVVDFGSLGGGVQIRCVTQAATSGFDALRKAGFTYDPTARFGGLLCRIDGRPADDPCINAPPPDRYWAYWTAPAPGDAWVYSDTGAGNRVPPPGSVEGWAFSDGCDRSPGTGPCPVDPTTTTRPRTTTTTLARGAAGDTGGTPSTTAGAGAADAGGGTTTMRPDGSTPTTSTTPSEAQAPGAGEPGDDEDVALAVDAAAAADGTPPDDGGGGSAAGVVVGLAVALALVTGAVLTARRRRAHEGAP